MSSKQLSRRMSAEDAWFLYFEKPNAPLHIGSVAIFEGDIPYQRICDNLAARIHTIPRYRQRAVIPPLYAGHPTWEDDAEFSIERHVTSAELPAPGTREQLLQFSSDRFAPMLPRDRPLWDITIIHGVEGGQTAYLSRVHHCLVDGVSGIELLLALLDLTPDPPPVPPPAEPWDPKPAPDPLQAWAEAVFDQWAQSVRAIGDYQQDLLDPRRQLRRMTDFARAVQVALPVAMRPATPAAWNKPISGRRRAAWTEVVFQEVRAVRSALGGGTVNDVVLTLIGGALGRYLRIQGVRTEGMTVRVQIPVNVRSEDQKGALGNRVSMMLPEVPVGIEDAVVRLQAVREEMERLKAAQQADAFERLARLSENLPAMYHVLAGMNGVPQGTVNFVCTNVPGPQIPLYTVGHRMTAHYPMVPLAGDLGIGVGVTSFDKGLYFGIMSDPLIVGDVGLLTAYLKEEWLALRAAAGVPASNLPDFGAWRPEPGRNGASARVIVSPATPAA